MKAVIEFVGYFVSKTGREKFEKNFADDNATVRDIIIEAEKSMADRGFAVLENGELMNGVLVFYRKDNGGMERIFNPDTPLKMLGNSIVLANLMGGG
ncbi:MAG: hypothetical protein HQ557_19555 [Bacteroidetes bacterium]|nr:hypothetical protein [Bacteroidota bacterium]